MKTNLLKRLIAAAAISLPLVLSSEKISAQGYDFTYPDSISISSTLVDHGYIFNLYRNCSPAPGGFQNFPISYTLDAGAPNYEAIPWNPVLSFGNPFCQSVTAACTPSGPLNYQRAEVKHTFSTKANIAGPGLHNFQTTFGVTGFGNFEAANMGGTFGIEPKVFNAVSAGMVNSAPKFINPPVIFANVNQMVSFSSGAIDPDGDSLVYRLKDLGPWAGYNSGFTYLNPITANPALVLNSRTGNITFKPTAYNATAGPGAVENKYMVGMEVDEYRILNGQYTLIGTIQRAIMVNVMSNTNNSPALTATRNGSTLLPNTIIDVVPGMLVSINFSATDPDASNLVSQVTNVQSILSQAAFTIQNPNTAEMSWVPGAADVRKEPYFFNVTAQDDACPHPASVTHTYGIRVRNVLGIRSDFGTAAFTAFPNPFTDDLQFKLDTKNLTGTIIIYNLLGRQIDEIILPKTASGEQTITWQNASKHAAGTYVARFISAGKTIQTLKFTKLQ